ncbi:MAG TPA: hypothetical protein VH165_20685 [Kofleriaceae bacterium]|jgi:hypothetical protein|nr:hypothetical protein [Kofleriaceae bacterium]
MTRRRLALIAVWTLPSAILLAATAIVYAAFRIAPPARLDAAARTKVIAGLRTGLRDPALDPAPGPAPGPALDPALGAPDPVPALALDGPMVVTLWSGGRAVAQVDASGDLAAATADAAHQLHDAPGVKALAAADRAAARLQVDLITGHGPIGSGSWLFDHFAIPGIGSMLAVNPGVEGIGADIAGVRALLLPHELVSAKLLAAKRPSDAMPDFAMGVDLARIEKRLAGKAGHPATLPPPGSLYRFRTDTFVEAPDHTSAPVPLYRGLPPAPPLSAQALRDAALLGGRYLVAHLAPNGRYVYEHDLTTGSATDATKLGGNYSMPRHAGTTYFLAQLYRITRQPWLREPIERAFAHLVDLMQQGHCAGTLPDGTAFDCVIDRGEQSAQLGSTALAVVALAEYQRATDDTRYLALATRLAAWLLYMQRPDGSFRHLYNVRTRTPDDHAELLYYSGEATLALARMFTITADPRYSAAAARGLDWLVDWYDFFLAGFFFGEEHWTCIAAEAIWPAAQRDKYMTFCHDYGSFLRLQQAEPGEHPDEDDFAGSYNLTPFVVPYNTPAGSRTEAMISAYLLGKEHGTPDRRVAGQIRAALQYALGQQIRPDSDFNVLAGPLGTGDGAMPGTPIDRNIRIDYVQHVCSAMIRASEWIDTDP